MFHRAAAGSSGAVSDKAATGSAKQQARMADQKAIFFIGLPPFPLTWIKNLTN